MKQGLGHQHTPSVSCSYRYISGANWTTVEQCDFRFDLFFSFSFR